MLVNLFRPNTALILSFISCSIVSLGAGTLYMFSAYSREMENILSIRNGGEKVSVDIIGSIGDLGLYLGLIGGLIYDYFGCTITNIYGMLLTSFGYCFVWATLSGYLPSKVGLMCLYFFCIGHGSYAMYTNAYSTAINNLHPKHGGKVSGYFLALYGTSSIIFTFVYQYAINSNVIQLFFVFFCLVSCLNIFAIFTIGVLKNDEEESLLKSEDVKKEDRDLNSTIPVEPVDVTGLQLLMRLDFWVAFILFVLVTGCGLMWKNVLGTVNKAFDINVQSSMVITWSIVNTLARLICGFLSDTFSLRVRRTLWLIPCLFINFLSMLCYFFSPSVGILWFINIGSGLGYGAGFSILQGFVAITFGRKYIGINSGIAALAPAIGGTSFTAISIALTERVTNSSINGGDCIGPKCYEGTFLFCCVVLVVAMLLTFMLSFIQETKDLFAWLKQKYYGKEYILV